MANFPSRLAFASLLQYAPRGASAQSVLSRDVTYKVKQDGFVNQLRIIDFATERLAGIIAGHPFLADYFHPSATLVPVPRSSPLKTADALWPPLRICQSLQSRGLAATILPCLERRTPVQKSSTAASGKRPGPEDHYRSAGIRLVGRPSSDLARITLVDDVVTRGASFVGLVPLLREAFPAAEIRCFALVRTMSSGDIDHILDPVEGVISYRDGELSRHP
jgi:hypothetical protein